MENDTLTPQETSKAKQNVLNALINEPSVYTIDVLNNSSLPEHLKSKKELVFEVKPPVLDTLNRVARITNDMPEEVFTTKEKSNIDLLKYVNEMVEIVSIFIHGGSRKKQPGWYQQFLLDNCSPDEITFILQECMIKCKTDFFLPYFQTAKQMNPMQMTTKAEYEKTMNG